MIPESGKVMPLAFLTMVVVFCLTMVVVFCLVLPSAAMAIQHGIDKLVDPHIDDQNYCSMYARLLDFRTSVDYMPNVDIAEKVCDCKWEDWPPGSTYPGIWRCERRNTT